MTNISNQTALLADEAAINKLTAKFADSVNRRESEEFCSLWHSQGVWELKPPMSIKVEGIEQILATFTQLLENWEFFVQMVHSGVVAIEGDRATARWCMNEIGRSTVGKGFVNYGLYEDELVRENGIWLFAKRTYHFAYVDEPSLPGQVFSLTKIP